MRKRKRPESHLSFPWEVFPKGRGQSCSHYLLTLWQPGPSLLLDLPPSVQSHSGNSPLVAGPERGGGSLACSRACRGSQYSGQEATYLTTLVTGNVPTCKTLCPSTGEVQGPWHGPHRQPYLCLFYSTSLDLSTDTYQKACSVFFLIL